MAKQGGVISAVSSHPYLTIAGLIVAVIGVYYAYKMFKQQQGISQAGQQTVQPSQYTQPTQTTTPTQTTNPNQNPYANLPQSATGGLTAGYVGGNLAYSFYSTQATNYNYSSTVNAPQTTTTNQLTYSPQTTVSNQQQLQYNPSYNAGTNVNVLGLQNLGGGGISPLGFLNLTGAVVGTLWSNMNKSNPTNIVGAPTPQVSTTIPSGSIPLAYTPATSTSANVITPSTTPLPSGFMGVNTVAKTLTPMTATNMSTTTTKTSNQINVPVISFPQFTVPFLNIKI